MAMNQFHFVAILTLLLASGANRSLFADELGSHDAPYRFWIEDASVGDDADLQFAVDSESDSDFYFVQEGAADSGATAPSLSRDEAVAARRRRPTYRLPSMFGDYF